MTPFGLGPTILTIQQEDYDYGGFAILVRGEWWMNLAQRNMF